MNEALGSDLEKEAQKFQQQQETQEASEQNEKQEKNEASEAAAEYPFDGGVMVFGHGWSNKNGQLSIEAKMRATAAYQLWKDGLSPRIIFTGGPPSENDKKQFGDDIISNSEQMAKFVQDKFKVPSENIVTENQSFKTVDNVAHALNSLEAKGLPMDDFLTVSTGYHMDRISEIMSKYDLKSQPVSAEEGLNQRALEHAEKMKQRDIEKGLASQEVEKRFLERRGKYDRAIHRIYRSNEQIQNEFEAEEKWRKAMKMPGYWLPLALAVRGNKLKELVTEHKTELDDWLSRHPDIELSSEDLIEGNFDYKKLVEEGREMPS